MGATIRDLWGSFRHSVGGLLNSDMTADDIKGLLWLGVVGVVLVVFLSILRAFEKRGPMR